MKITKNGRDPPNNFFSFKCMKEILDLAERKE